MIPRYTRKEMENVWQLENRFQKLLEVEVAVARAQSEQGLIPKSAYQNIQKKAKFSVKRIEQIENKTKHDIIAFVSNVAENIGKDGRFVHYNLTSSDVLDTALSLQIRDAGQLIIKDIVQLKKSLRGLIRKHKATICAGRTHGMHAEPTTFGYKICGHLEELNRCEKRFAEAIANSQIVKLSGSVGTYSAQSEKIEKKVGRYLKLQPESVATQVVPRDRHADVIYATSMLGCFLERLSVELRHLQRTEVGEVIEGFSKGQKGSSAMPHKKNPISSENLTGIARLLRSHLIPTLENVALWHERDISHSSVERVVFPDAFIALDYALNRMSGVLDQLYVDKERMKKNMDISQGQLFSSHVLLALVDKGLAREDAYARVQKLSHSIKTGEHLKQAILKDSFMQKTLSAKEVDEIFSGQKHLRQIEKRIQETLSRS